MEELLKGASEFNNANLNPKLDTIRPLLAKLGKEGQFPQALFITCADSRVDPSLIMHALPGDLFILRNIGNIVPVAYAGDTSVAATVEYAIHALGVEQIAICGHSDCGAMKAVHARKDLHTMPTAAQWLANARRSMEAYETNTSGLDFPDDMPEVDRLAQVNVVTQFKNLMTHQLIRERMEAGTLRLVGLYFDIASATVLMLNGDQTRFVPIDQELITKHVDAHQRIY